MSSFISRLFLSLFLSLTLLLNGCGYTIQGTKSRSPVLENAGIRKIYVRPVLNNSYKAGVEITVYNALVKKIASRDQVKLVHSEKDADAVLIAIVNSADYISISSTAGSNLEPKTQSEPLKNLAVASVYSARLDCGFSLESSSPTSLAPSSAPSSADPSSKTKEWTASFSRSKSFPANNQVGVPGTTSAIINDSEFDRAIADLAESMMIDVHESLISMF